MFVTAGCLLLSHVTTCSMLVPHVELLPESRHDNMSVFVCYIPTHSAYLHIVYVCTTQWDALVDGWFASHAGPDACHIHNKGLLLVLLPR